MNHHLYTKALITKKNPTKHLLLFILATFHLLMSPTTLSSVENEESQVFLFQDGYQHRSVVQGNLLFNLRINSHDESSAYFQELFSISDNIQDKRYQYTLTIMDLSTGEILFEDASPDFDLVFVDTEQDTLILVQRLDYTAGEIWALTTEGDIFYQAAFNTLEDRKQVSRSLSAISYLTSQENISSKHVNYDIVSNDNESEGEARVIIACGRIPYWLASIESIEFDYENNLSGFTFKNHEQEFYFFDLNLASRIKTELKEEFRQELKSETLFLCPDGFSLGDNLYGRHYSRWCEDTNASQQGPVEVWTKIDKYQSIEASQTESETMETTSSFILIGTGQYVDGQKEGDWKLHSIDLEYSDQCEFDGGLLHGTCLSNDYETEIVTPFKDDLTNGWVIDSYDGVIESECHYQDGYRYGECTSRDNGFIDESCIYNGLSKTGICTEYFQSSMQIKSVCEMFDGQYHGTCTEFDRTGNIKQSEHYQFDELILKEI
jgi:antitoxin component YwqK of YwqJK toxin-antitoxin module